MLRTNKNIQQELLLCTMEDLVPENSIFRKIDKYIDFNFIYDFSLHSFNLSSYIQYHV